MATEKVKLRDYQQSILDKLEMIREDASNVPSNYLGVEISGSQSTEISSDTRMLLIGDDISSNVGFLVDRLVGLRNFEKLKKKKKTEKTICFQPERYEDEEGNLWYVLDCERLVSSKEFEVPYAV